ncbi:MAG: restriction endonuclease, partial [Anaerolineae bacterium]
RGKKPKPEAVYREAEAALLTLVGQWKERFEYIQAASDTQDKTPPVLIVVCDNTDIAELFYRHISGEHIEETVAQKGKRKVTKRVTVYGQGRIFPEYFSNTAEFPRRTVRIDSKLLDKAESGDPSVSRQDAAEQLRRIVSTVGKPGEPGEQVRCVVSVSMLTEGWDANNVTHIFGLRAFTSQLLCEQVVGRGLRRMDYTPDPETGMLTEEYVDIYGIPFSLIPFKGRQTKSKAPEDKPKNHVHALPERAHLEIRFPVVEGYAAALQKNAIIVDVDQMEPLRLEPELEPTAVFVKPRVVTELGSPTLSGPGQTLEHDRQAFYDSTHLQTIEFEIARRVMTGLLDPAGRHAKPKLRLQSRHQLFPQILRYVRAYVQTKVDFRGVDPRELGQQRYTGRIVGRMLDAIRPDVTAGETPLLPILNRYAPTGTTTDVEFKTTRPVKGTIYSHINAVPTHTKTWENSAAFHLELAARDGVVRAYARNDGLEFTIPYEYYGIHHSYEPDFLAKLIVDPDEPQRDVTLIVEVKGYETDQDRAKHQAARRWVAAVNNWGKLGQWDFYVTRDPQLLRREAAFIRSRYSVSSVQFSVFSEQSSVFSEQSAAGERAEAQPGPVELPK